MSSLMMAPDALTVAAADIARVGSTIAEANTVASVPILGVLPPAADSVSAQLAELFGGHAETYQSVSAVAEGFHRDFLNTWTASATRYVQAEADSATGLGKGPTPGGLRLLGSRQHQTAGTSSRLWQPGSAASRLWRPGMADPRLLTPHQTVIGQGSQLWRPGTASGLLAHPPLAPRILVPNNGLQGGILNGSGGVLQQFIQNQIGYLKLIAASLKDFVTDEFRAIMALPAAFEQALNDLVHGNIKGAMQVMNKAFLHFFLNTDSGGGIAFQDWGHNYHPPGISWGDWTKYTLTGALPDLWQLMQIPAQEMQNLANLLGTGGLGKLAQFSANKLSGLANGFALYTSGTGSDAGQFGALQMGKGLRLTLDLLGAPIVSMHALEDSLQGVADNLVAGHLLRAGFDLLASPVSMMHAFLFGQDDLQFTLGRFSERVHIGGLFTPLEYPLVNEGDTAAGWRQSLPPYGAPTGGIVAALVSQLPPWLQAPLNTLGAFIESIIAELHQHQTHTFV